MLVLLVLRMKGFAFWCCGVGFLLERSVHLSVSEQTFFDFVDTRPEDRMRPSASCEACWAATGRRDVGLWDSGDW